MNFSIVSKYLCVFHNNTRLIAESNSHIGQWRMLFSYAQLPRTENGNGETSLEAFTPKFVSRIKVASRNDSHCSQPSLVPVESEPVWEGALANSIYTLRELARLFARRRYKRGGGVENGWRIAHEIILVIRNRKKENKFWSFVFICSRWAKWAD